jgi:hypothetical protein
MTAARVLLVALVAGLVGYQVRRFVEWRRLQILAPAPSSPAPAPLDLDLTEAT